MPVHRCRKESTIAERVQALTLYSVGQSTAQIEAAVGIASATFRALFRRAKSRGYVVGDKILEEHVASASRSGRPQKKAKQTDVSTGDGSGKEDLEDMDQEDLGDALE